MLWTLEYVTLDIKSYISECYQATFKWTTENLNYLWWRHFRSPSLCLMATGNDVTTNPRWRPEVTSPQIQDADRKWRHHKSKIATGSDVITNPRWRPEVTSQIQDGDQPQSHHSTKSSPYTTPIARDSWPREILWHDYVVFIYRGPNQVDGSMFQKKTSGMELVW